MKKVISTILCMLIMVFSMPTVSLAAEGNIEDYPIIDISMDSVEGTIDVPDETPQESGILNIETEFSGVATFDTNTPPVAGLEYVILNPESVVNGNITTNTQIAWLWSYNGENYTYDVDGDAITNIHVGGIPSNSIIGYITGDIGFATQIDTAGQYQMTYQVTDARGALSNIVKVVINVEPANSNTRPICNITHNLSAEFMRTNESLVVSWQNSYDNDPGDSIFDVKGLVYKDGSETSQDLSTYIESITADGCSMGFSSAGSYEIWISVCDTNNSWSDWCIFTVEVKSHQASLSNVQLTGVMTDTDPGENGYWVDNFLARELSYNYQPSRESLNLLVQQTGSKYYPNMSKTRVGMNYSISGTLKYNDGTPCVNTPVTIRMPMTRAYGLKMVINTDASGNFSYSPVNQQYWVDMKYDYSTVNFPFSGDYSGLFTQYCHYSNLGTNFYYPTTISVEAENGGSWSKDVAALAGIARTPCLGRILALNINGKLEWTEMP